MRPKSWSPTIDLAFLTIVILLVSLSLFARHSTAQKPSDGYRVDTNAANGLNVTTFNTPQGQIKVNLPDDMAAGDTISGTVVAEPAGKTETEHAKNKAELNGYVVELDGQKTTVAEKNISFSIPTALSTEAKTIVLLHNSQRVAATEISISATPPPTPTAFTLPTGGQQGRPIEIKGPCDGNFAPSDYVKVGGTVLPPIAESPRKTVVSNTSDAVGPTNIEIKEHGAVTQCPFRNVGINLSAPKLSLRRGETTTLHVAVTGLAGITQDLPLDLLNTSPSIIRMSGGEVQHMVIHPNTVQQDGTSVTDRTLTGNMAGSFIVTGTVTWPDVCKKEVNGGVIAGGPGPVSQPTPSPTPVTPTDTVEGTICKDTVYKTYKPSDFKRVDSSDTKTLKVRSESGHGGSVVVYYHCVGTGTYSTNFTVTKDDGTKEIIQVNCSP